MPPRSFSLCSSLHTARDKLKSKQRQETEESQQLALNTVAASPSTRASPLSTSRPSLPKLQENLIEQEALLVESAAEFAAYFDEYVEVQFQDEETGVGPSLLKSEDVMPVDKMRLCNQIF
ncbi:hypothetical protein IAR50_004118 [Cryptococcus sp. DSM 104548]